MGRIIGQVVAFVASFFMTAAGFPKKKSTSLTVQICADVLLATSNFLLGSITGGITVIISIFRGILCQLEKLTIPVKIIFILVSGAFTIAFNNMGIMGFLPFATMVIMVCFMTTKDDARFKMVNIIATAIWLIHDAYIGAWGLVLFDVFTISSYGIGIIRIKRAARQSSSVSLSVNASSDNSI